MVVAPNQVGSLRAAVIDFDARAARQLPLDREVPRLQVGLRWPLGDAACRGPIAEPAAANDGIPAQGAERVTEQDFWRPVGGRVSGGIVGLDRIREDVAQVVPERVEDRAGHEQAVA